MRDDLLLLGRRQAAPVMGTERGFLHASGPQIYTESGQAWWGIGITAFPMLEKWLRGERDTVERFVDYMVKRRIGVARVLGMYHRGHCEGIGNFHPQEFGGIGGYLNWLDGAMTLAEYLGERGTRLDFQVFADMQTDDCKPNNPLSQIDQVAMFKKVAYYMGPEDNVLLGIGNQLGKNGVDPSQFERPLGYCSRGSGLEEQLPYLPAWTDSEFHPGRGDEFARKFKSVHDLRIGDTSEGVRVDGPIRFTEPIGIGNVENGSTTMNAHRMWMFAAGCKQMGVAALYAHARSPLLQKNPDAPHDSPDWDHNTLSVPVEGSPEDLTIQAMVDAYMRVPGTCAFGAYSRGSSPTEPYNAALPIAHHDAWASRTYSMRVGNTAVVTVTDPNSSWPGPQTQNGWQIQQAFGLAGKPETAFLMTR